MSESGSKKNVVYKTQAEVDLLHAVGTYENA